MFIHPLGDCDHKMTDDQFYKIEFLRISMLNHIATCDHSQCQLVFKGHYD